MDRWKYFAIGHQHHAVCNPMSVAKIDEIVALLDLPERGRCLDVGCGKAELLVRIAQRWRCAGVGVDLSPQFVAEARSRVESSGLVDAVEIVEANGSDYRAPAGSFDAAICLGASWIWNGLEGTLRALAGWTRPGGVVVMGEPFWRRPPSREYLEMTELEESICGTHLSNAQTGLALGLSLLHTVVSSEDDWDRYEGYQWLAAERYARRHPDDPDVPELLQTMRRQRDAYLRFGRDELGWAVYLFLKDPRLPEPVS